MLLLHHVAAAAAAAAAAPSCCCIILLGAFRADIAPAYAQQRSDKCCAVMRINYLKEAARRLQISRFNVLHWVEAVQMR
jgi:hypothetical protein